MDVNGQIIEFVKQKGPVLPVQVAKEINSNILMASAHLSELVSSKKLMISNLKIGGSPLYYFPGHEFKLQNFSSNLHEKEQKAYHLLSQKKILRDEELEPMLRVVIRQIKDFALPLQVNYKGRTEIFWKWYLTPSSEAGMLIKSIIKEQEPKKEVIEKKTVIKEPMPKQELQKELKKPKIEKIIDNFSKQVSNYFEKNKIEVIEQNIIRKNSEIDFVVRVPSSVGLLIYYCKAKNKKKITDGDLSSTYVQSQSKKMPVLFLITGQLTKKAKEMLKKEFKGMNVKQI